MSSDCSLKQICLVGRVNLSREALVRLPRDHVKFQLDRPNKLDRAT